MERYKIRDFARWAKKEGLSDRALMSALNEMYRGLLGDRLGAHVYKKRLGLSGRGKSGGVRTIVLFKIDEVAVFIYGYLKNEKANLSPNEEEAIRVFARGFMRLSAAARADRVRQGALVPLGEEDK